MITTEKSPDSGPIKILWTGGWDSTFQFLQLLLVQKKRVVPYYLIDELRPSTGHELLAMQKIRASICKIDNEVGKLIQPTQFHFVSDVTKQPKITKAYEAIRKRSFIGSQYDWLARFCAQEGISDLQLCIHRDDKAHAVVMNMATRWSDSEAVFRIDDAACATDEHTVFKYFSFPILSLTKTEMQQISQDLGWEEIMLKTWFCHKPKHGSPCGVCNPCLYTLDEGLGWRIPKDRRFLARLNQRMWHPTKKILMRAFSRA